MVEGLRVFSERFGAYGHAFVVIGGTACAAILERAGLAFRATKDIDVVLFAEAVDASFVRAFRDFVDEGGYEARYGDSGKRRLFRFEKPSVTGFPQCIELFSRSPMEELSTAGNRMKIQVAGADASLSAILMDDDYYSFVQGGTERFEGLPIATIDRLIPLKAKAWLDLNARKEAGEAVDSGDIEKHRKDVLRLFAVLEPDLRVEAPLSLRADLAAFIEGAFAGWTPNMKSLGLQGFSLVTVANGLRALYAIFGGKS